VTSDKGPAWRRADTVGDRAGASAMTKAGSTLPRRSGDQHRTVTPGGLAHLQRTADGEPLQRAHRD
jgi:hypothetical protein